MTKERKILLFVITTFIAIALGLLAYGRISQPTEYHHFADARLLWGIPNFWNVVTNVFFLMAGYWGLYVFGTLLHGELPRDGRAALLVFALGSIGVAGGSALYHAFPSSETLVWDRLPMTVCFAAIAAEFVATHISTGRSKLVLFGTLLFSVGSVVYWKWTGLHGADDLRPYIITQFFPILVGVATALFFERKERWSPNWTRAVLWYGGAKVLEYFDTGIYILSDAVVSGHSLKHIASGIACYYVINAMRERRINTQNA